MVEILKSTIRRGLRRLGADVHRYRETLPVVRKHLLSRLAIDLVLDVGANKGQYVRELREAGFPGRIVSFEPLPDAFAELDSRFASDPMWRGSPLALGERDGTAMIHVAGNSASSSILEMSDIHLGAAPMSAYVGVHQTEVARLDSVADSFVEGSRSVLLKLDVQGYEMPVLRGARDTLERGPVTAIESELSLVPCYEGQALLHEVIEHLTRVGFVPVWLEKGLIDRTSSHLLQLDGLFIRLPEWEAIVERSRTRTDVVG